MDLDAPSCGAMPWSAASVALVGTGAGMLSGTLFHTAAQTSSIGPTVGIAFGSRLRLRLLR